MAAGADSTRSVYSSAMKALLENPDQMELLRSQPSLMANAVEECLRCFPPFQMMGRTAMKDVELHGQQIKEGDRLALWFVASNRDPEIFSDPHRFDITRSQLTTHQSFGAGGLHFCMGSSLARLELSTWIEKTLERFPTMELAGSATRSQALSLNQFTSVPVRIR